MDRNTTTEYVPDLCCDGETGHTSAANKEEKTNPTSGSYFSPINSLATPIPHDRPGVWSLLILFFFSVDPLWSMQHAYVHPNWRNMI